MLRLYDTRTRQVAPIEPARWGGLRMYSCGPTVYRSAHVGNLRSYLLADLIRRTAERNQLTVISCQNITDVGHLADDSEIDPAGEDKIIAQARAEGRSALDIARHYEAEFRADCDALNIRPADATPRASESIELMIELISRLLETGHAYPTPAGRCTSTRVPSPATASCPATGSRTCAQGTGAPPVLVSQGVRTLDKRFHADWALWKAAPADRELT